MGNDSESNIMNSIRIALSKYGCIVRLNSGTFYQGRMVSGNLTDIRPVKCGIPGMPDLMFIGDNGKVCFIEVKSATGKASVEQKRFLAFLNERKISCGIARSVYDALQIIGVEP